MVDAWSRSVELLDGGNVVPLVRWPIARVRVVIVSDETLETSRKPFPPTPAEQTVLDALSEAPLTATDIAAALDLKLATVTVRLQRMSSRGLVQRVGGSTWFTAASKER